METEEEKVKREREEKVNKMFPNEVALEICPKCGEQSVVPDRLTAFCTNKKCDYVDEKWRKMKLDDD